MSLVGPDILIVAVRYPRSQPTGLRGLERVDILRPPQGGGFQPQSSRTALLVRGSSPSPTAQEGSPRCHRMPCGGHALRRLGYRPRLNAGAAARPPNRWGGRGPPPRSNRRLRPPPHIGPHHPPLPPTPELLARPR